MGQEQGGLCQNNPRREIASLGVRSCGDEECSNVHKAAGALASDQM